eukprot:Selendium_serpulae@DN2974_c0_g1_i1.p1
MPNRKRSKRLQAKRKAGKSVPETAELTILQENTEQPNILIEASDKTKIPNRGVTVVDGTPKASESPRPELALDTSVQKKILQQSHEIALAGTSRTPIRTPLMHISKTPIRTPLRTPGRTPSRTPRLHRLSYRLTLAKQAQKPAQVKSPFRARSRNNSQAPRRQRTPKTDASRSRYNFRLRGAGGKKSRTAQILNEDLVNCIGEDMHQARIGAFLDQYFIEGLP